MLDKRLTQQLSVLTHLCIIVLCVVSIFLYRSMKDLQVAIAAIVLVFAIC